MQTTETKKDYRKEIKALNRRLAAYRLAYMQTALEWLNAFMDDLSNITDDRYGWTRIHASMEIEDRLHEPFVDLWDIRRPYSPQELREVWHNFYEKQIKPINEALDEDVKAWYICAWKAYRVDFKAVPPAPQPTPTQFQKINARTYQLGQVIVKVDKERHYRETHFVTPDGIVLYIRRCHGITIEDCLSLALPIAKRINRLGNWAQYSTLPTTAQVAMKEKLRVVVMYQDDGYEYKKMRRKFPLWWSEEELEAILQAEKDRHAPRH